MPVKSLCCIAIAYLSTFMVCGPAMDLFHLCSHAALIIPGALASFGLLRLTIKPYT